MEAGRPLRCMFIKAFLVLRSKVHPALSLRGKSSCVNFPKTDVGKSKYRSSGPIHATVEMEMSSSVE